jgi:DedD protein
MCPQVGPEDQNMDSAMRDIEQIREREDEGEGRPLALVGLLVGVTVILVLALGMVVGGWWSEDEEIAANDPLARLDRAAGLAVEPAPSEPTELPDVDRSALTFPEALAPDERPEVAAALAAARAELEHPDPIDAPMVDPLPFAAEPIEPGLPAALAADETDAELARTVTHDALVARSIPAPPDRPMAPAGRDGEYTVQVISYDSPEGADAFAAALRQRGHRAFVVSAQVEGRGTMYRVRVGPFETQREAQEYRREFERAERMSTLLVRRPQEP